MKVLSFQEKDNSPICKYSLIDKIIVKLNSRKLWELINKEYKTYWKRAKCEIGNSSFEIVMFMALMPLYKEIGENEFYKRIKRLPFGKYLLIKKYIIKWKKEGVLKTVDLTKKGELDGKNIEKGYEV